MDIFFHMKSGSVSNEISGMRRDIVCKHEHAKYGNPRNQKTYCKSTLIFHCKFCLFWGWTDFSPL